MVIDVILSDEIILVYIILYQIILVFIDLLY